MKAKAAFTQFIQPKLIQYMIDNYGYSYDTPETVKNTWRRTYPVSDEIIENMFVQVKAIEKISLGHSSRLVSFQTLLTETIADYLVKYVRRCPNYENLSKEEVMIIIKQNIDISKNRKSLKPTILDLDNESDE